MTANAPQRCDLVLVHGMWGGAWQWEGYRRRLAARGHRIQVPDLRHHDAAAAADPPPRLGTVSLRDYVDDLDALIAGLPTPPVVIGHSLGGLLAQLLAARGRVAGAVLLTPAPPAGVPALRLSVVRAFAGVVTRWGFWRRPVRQGFAAAAATVYNRMPPDAQRALYDRSGFESGRVVLEVGLPWLDRRRAAAVDPARVTCPLLVVGARHDRITPVPVVRRIARRYGAVATYHELPDHAHWVLGEPGWERVADLVAGWVEGLPIGPRSSGTPI